MIDAVAIQGIISQYSKHGWKLRRILLSDGLRKQLLDTRDIFHDAELVFSDLDALWFSRSSKAGAETWELRRLSHFPYALDAFIVDEMDGETRESILIETENRLRETGTARSEN